MTILWLRAPWLEAPWLEAPWLEAPWLEVSVAGGSVAGGSVAGGSVAKGSVAKESMQEDSVDEDSTDEDSTDEDYTDEDSWGDDSVNEEPVQAEPALKESTHDTPQEAPQPGSSNTSTHGLGACFIEVDYVVPFTQVYSQTSSSNNGAGSIQGPGTSAMEVDGAASVTQESSPSSSSSGVPNKAPEDKNVEEPVVFDPQAVYDEALQEVAGLKEAIILINSQLKGNYTGRTFDNTVRKLCSSIDEFCANKAKDPDERARMLKAVREKLAQACPPFVWREDTGKCSFKKPVGEKKASVAEGPAVYDADELCKEAEIRFGTDIDALEHKLLEAVGILSAAQNKDFTLRDLCEFLEDGTSPSLVTEGLVPENLRDDSPRIYTMGGRLWVNAGTAAETVEIADGRLERALVLCLVLYYIKNLDYPEAFWRVMYVLQLVLNPSGDPPNPPKQRNGKKCSVTWRMRYLLDLLGKERDTSGPETK
ncbi:hypothetical protein MTO96_049449 [Rhipicephalus appendiculatus]